jgi:hypothetical protein
MFDAFRLLLLMLGSGIVGLCAGALIKHRIQAEMPAFGPFTVHGWYASGILSFLLVCAVASDWGSIPELATILSFAVGLASLILALIAIIQALTSTSGTQSALAAIQEAARGTLASGTQLGESISAIRQAADQAASAASAAMDATQTFASLGTSLIESTEAGRVAIDALRSDVRKQLLADVTKQRSPRSDESHANVFKNDVTFGGAWVSYAALLSFKTGKAFSPATLLPDMPQPSFERGYISALDDLGFITIKRQGGDVINVIDATPEFVESCRYAREKTFTDPGLNERHKERVQIIDRFFQDDGLPKPA